MHSPALTSARQPAAVLPGATDTAAAPAELTVQGLARRFAAGPVFEAVSFTVGHGEAVALLGANGAGKSTLLRCCIGLTRPSAGRVRLLGRDPAGCRPGELRRLRAEVGFVFQRHNLVPRLSALSNVLHGALDRTALPAPGCWLHALAPAALREQAMDCLDQVGLADLAGRRVDRLSGGQSQRVAVARALMQRPRLILADEPAASLDPAAGDEVMALFLDLVRRHRLSLLFSTHHIAHALRHADRVLGLKAGGLALDAPVGALAPERLHALYD